MEIYQRMVEWKIEIPNDVMEEIVMRLPVRSIVRFQAVSKHWEWVIKTRDFGARHIAHQRSSKDPKLMFVFFGLHHIRFEQRDLETASLEESLYLAIEECDDKWEIIFSVDLNSTSCWFGGITSQPLTPLAISRDNNKVVLSLSHQENLVDFDLDPDSTVYHLYYSGDYGLAVPYFPSLSPGYATC